VDGRRRRQAPASATGQTDEFGYFPVENPVSIRDLQATIEHLVGLDPYRFSYPYQGLNNRLIGPTEEGGSCTTLLPDTWRRPSPKYLRMIQSGCH
jgi:hypothetical protein